MRKLFLFLILLCSTNFLSLNFFQFLPFDLINLSLSFYFIIYVIVNRKSWGLKYFRTYRVFLLFFLFAILFSSFIAYIDWNQSFLTTLITTRSLLWLSFGLYLIKSKTKLSELYSVFSIFSWVYIFFSLLVVFFPNLKESLLYVSSSEINKIDQIIFIGLSYLLFTFYYILSKFLLKRKVKLFSAIQSLLILIVIYYADNRATIFALLFLTSFSFVLFSRFNLFLKLILGFLFLFGSYYLSFERINRLVDETEKEIVDKDNPRIRGLDYFYNSFSKSQIGFFLGNGLGSQKNQYGKKILILKERDGLYLSDLGLFGMFIYFGVFYLLSFVIPLFLILKSSEHFLHIKLLVLHFLFAWTYFSFLNVPTMVLFVSALYIFDYNYLKIVDER